MRSYPRLRFFILLAALLVSACSPAKDPSGLVDFAPKSKGYSMQIPEDWEAVEEAEAHLVTFRPRGSKNEAGDLKVELLFAPVEGEDNDARLIAIKEQFEPFLSTRLDDTYTVVNQGETRVGMMNAVVIDAGKPWNNTYLAVREVLVNSDTHAIAFLGSGEDEAWQIFLPRFRAMLASFQLDIPEATPLPGGFKP